MKQALPHRLPTLLLTILLPLFLLVLSADAGFAQCPVTNSCTPGNPPAGNVAYGMGILHVNINNGAISNTTPAVTATTGYVDYSCTIGTTLSTTVTYPISIQTNNNVNENVRVWLDMDNNGVFNATTELIFSSANKKLHTGTFSLPASAVTGAPLRMRVSADNFSSALPTPCSTPQYSQVEDYRLTLVANTQAPAAEFSADNTTTCTGTVNFTDLSQNGPTAWSWNFGDPGSGTNNTSTLQNPSHTFSGPGTYTIRLIVTNANGSDTLTKTNYITYHTNVPVAAACAPATQNYCCGYGITNFNFGNGLIVNASADGSAGYEDFSCSKSASVIAGYPYPVSITTGINPQDTRIYLDLNNDGLFTGAGEMIFEKLNTVNPTINVLIPASVTLNTPIRMRIISDEIGSSFTSCGGIISGQAEDYTIIASANPHVPIAQFSSDHSSFCDTTVTFTDQSLYLPTSWNWNFGDPASGVLNTSTLQNPTHIYHNAGVYTVTLSVTNANGNDSIVKTGFINISKPCVNYCQPSGISSGFWIRRVNLNSIDNISGQVPGGYSDFTHLSADLVKGNSATLNVTPEGSYINASVSAWIDYNRNGIFETSEQVVTVSKPVDGTPYSGTFTIPATAALGPTRMRIITVVGLTPTTNPCPTSGFTTEVEDYTIRIHNTPQPLEAKFTVNSQVSCTGSVLFTDNSINGPTNWIWDFGDPASGASNTSTQQNPTHVYSQPGFYTVKLIASNSLFSDTLVKPNYIYKSTPCISYCSPNNFSNGSLWIQNVSLNNFSNPSGKEPNGYGDYTSKFTNLALGTSATLTVNGYSPNALTAASAWIDFNRNGTFEATEKVMSINWVSIPNFTSTFTVPGWAQTGATRMRIIFTVGGFNAPDNPCITSGSNTEMEDYSIVLVPGPFKPTALFTSQSTSSCDSLVTFTDQSLYAPTTWLWNFGDPASGLNNTSTLQHPAHTFSGPGTYTVSLHVTNSIGADSIIKQGNITIISPCVTYCPAYGFTNTNRWITNVSLNNLNNTSGKAPNKYSDFTSLSAVLQQGVPATLTVTSGGSASSSGVSAWIDYNQNGVFEVTERVMAVSNAYAPATATILVTGAAKIGPTRMRIISSNVAHTNSCNTSSYDTEVEDYTVVIQPNPMPPVVDFTVNSQISCSGTEQFMDISMNVPTSWAWDFGDPASGTANTSTLQNPVHIFSAPGTYTVSLTATNQYGTSTLTKTNYINFDPVNTFCTTVIMPATGTGPVATGCSGTIYDPGGPTGQYPNSGNGTLTIAPTGAVFVRLDFTMFDFETYNDELRIYDGPSTSSPLIGTYGGTSLPNGGTIISTGPAITLRFISDSFTRMNGFAANWTCIMPMVPVADFKVNLDSLCTGPVTFQDMSVNVPTSWQWDFGDPASGAANFSTLQNPSHTYANTVPGTYTVKLIACNSLGCDTIVKTNYIPMAVPCLTYCASSGHYNNNQWIDSVAFGNMINLTGKETNGYGNYTYLSSNIVLGTTTPISVRIGNTYPTGYVTVWIDLNKDGIFQTNEKLFHGSTNRVNFGDPWVASGSITIPNTVQAGATRMRVLLSNNYQQNNPCSSNLNFGETEDYMVNFLPNALPLAGEFTGSLNTVCSGTVQFKDASVNGATSWQWNFGDPASGASNTSALQNPIHHYPTATTGSYTVSLIVCKGAQCDTITKTNYINIPVPCPTYCIPTGHSNSGQWISNVTVAGLNNTTARETDGYGNYTNQIGNLVANSTGNPVSVTLDYIYAANRQVRIWIDFNKNGIFEQQERVFNEPALLNTQQIASGNISVPGTAQPGFTRMRVIMDGSASNPCLSNLSNTEVEDYTINILPNTLPLVADFKPDMTNICTGAVAFYDVSVNGATSWQWDFGDPASGANNISTLQNPTHTYSTTLPGSYTVTLIACKGTQCDTITKQNLINTLVPCRTYCASSGHNNGSRWISNVSIGAINNPTGAEINGYGDYTYLSTDLMLGVPTPVTVNIINSGYYMYATIWIDYNQDGIFTTNEKLLHELTRMNAAGIIEAKGNLTLPGTALPGYTRMRVIMSPVVNMNSPCIMNFPDIETEDYFINILPNPDPLVANFKASRFGDCSSSINFFDTSINGSTSWLWNFGDPASGANNISTLQNPVHVYSNTSAASYDVTLIACKGTQCDTITKVNAINITVPCHTYCMPVSINNSNQWLSNVSIGSINNTTGPEPNGYGNYFYESTTAHSGLSGIPVSVTLGNSAAVAGYVKIWVDFNQDGTYQSSEQVFNTQAALNSSGQLQATGSFIIPPGALFGATRMRVMINPDNNNYACVNYDQSTEIEEYMIVITQNPIPPVASFTANPLITCNGSVTFTDASANYPTAWQWNFGDPGSGTANTSAVQNPTHTFSASGLYTITLITSNAFGSDTLTKTNYINYDPGNIACRTIIMPVSGTLAPVTSCTGLLFDNGGPTGNYSNNVNGTAVIAPPNATSVSLTFTSFITENTWDALKIFDGPGISSPLIGTYSGAGLPNGGAPITTSGGTMTIQFITNGSNNFPGFEANWTCNTQVGLTETSARSGFEVFPNPSTGIVNLKLTDKPAGHYNLEITNVLGEVLLKQPVTLSDQEMLPVDLTRLARGVYFIRLQNDKTSGTRKLVLD